MKYILYLMIYISVCFAQKYVADFIHLDYGAKTLASGNVFFMNKGDLAAVRWFPADYSFNSQPKVFSTFVSKYDGLLKQAHLGYSQPMLGGYNVTVNWNYSGVTDIPSYGKLILQDDKLPENKTPKGYFDNMNHVGSLTFSKLFDEEIDLGWDYFKLPIKIPVALNVNYLHTTLYEYTATAFTMDVSFGFITNLGTLFKIKGMGDFGLYLNAKNIAGSKLAWDTIETSEQTTESFESISKNVVWGVSFFQPANDLNIDFSFGLQFQSLYSDFSYGFSFLYDKFIDVRLGFDNRDVTFGVGALLGNLDIFVSMKPTHDLGKSLNLDFAYGL